MKPQLFLLFFSILITNLHAQLREDFSDGNFTANPPWSGQSLRFIVNAQQELQLNDLAPVANNVAHLFTKAPTSLNDSTTWECYVRMAFAASSSNFARIYLAANQLDSIENVNGYFVKIGGATGSTDAVELFRQDGSSATLLVSGARGAVGGDSVVVRVRVTRSKAGEWTLFTDYSGARNFQQEESAIDTTYSVSNFFGIYCRYSSTRSKAFFFDDIAVNPLYEDKISPTLQKVVATSAEQVELTFSESLDAASASNSDNYNINKNIGNPISAVLISANQVLLTLNSPLEDAMAYTLTVKDIQDVSGNAIQIQSQSFTFYDIQPIVPGDLRLNEILFDPKTGGSDFIELYNVSSKSLNLNGLQIQNAQKMGSTALRSITSDFLMPPKSYVAISEEPRLLIARYQPPALAIFLENALPSFDDDEGNVTLRMKDVTIDSFDYQDDYHFALLSDKEGVSLERINPSAPTQGSNNWQSAAAAVLFATPGYRNSQFMESTNAGDEPFAILNATFSPDGDGFEDVLLLDYKAEQPGLTANLRVFDANGRLVKKLVENELLGANGNFKWDGTNQEGAKARLGIYVIWIEIFSTQGIVNRYKKTCVLAGKLD